jgi:hypothetical protein
MVRRRLPGYKLTKTRNFLAENFNEIKGFELLADPLKISLDKGRELVYNTYRISV